MNRRSIGKILFETGAVCAALGLFVPWPSVAEYIAVTFGGAVMLLAGACLWYLADRKRNHVVSD